MIKAYAPGRVKLFGVPSDAGEGPSLAFAVERGVLVSGSVRQNREILVYARDWSATFEGSLDVLSPSAEKPWANPILGVFDAFRRRGLELGGVNLTIQSDLPRGAGLGSGSALAVATALFIERAFGHALERVEIARIAREAESDFSGVACGMFDPLASLFGSAGSLSWIDLKSLKIKEAALPADLRFVIADVGVKRKPPREEDLALEKEHIAAALRALEAGDRWALGALMLASYESGRRYFENASPQVDRLVAVAREVRGWLGATRSGGGMVHLIEAAHAEMLAAVLESAVPTAKCFVTKAAPGAHVEG